MILHRPHTAPVHALAFSPDGGTLAVGEAGRVQLLDWQAGIVTGSVPNPDPTHPPRGMTFGAAGPVWERHRTPVAGATGWAWGAGHVSVRVGWAMELTLYDRASDRAVGAAVVEVWQHDAGSQMRAAWADSAGQLRVWCGRTQLRYDPPAVGERPPRTWLQRVGVALTPPADVPPLHLAAEHVAPVVPQAVAPLLDGETVLLADRGTVRRWHPAIGFTGQWRWRAMQWVRAVAVSPDGLVAAAADRRGRVLVFDLD